MAFYWRTFFPLIPACALFMLPLERRGGFWRRLLQILAAYIAAYLLFAATQWSSPSTFFWMLRPLLSLVFSAVFVQYCLRGAWWESLYCAIWAYLTKELCYDFTVLVMNVLFPEAVGLSTQSAHWRSAFDLAVLISHAVAFSAVYCLIARNLGIEGHYPVSRRQILTPALLAALVTAVKPIGVVLGLENFVLTGFTLAQVLCTFFGMATLYSQAVTGRQEALQTELEAQRLLWAQHEKQLASAKQQAELLNMKYHDLKHYIAAIRDQPNLIQQARTLDEMENAVRVFNSMVRTGNEILDTVLTEKGLLCEQEQIVLSCVVDGALLRDLATVDLYVLFGNAIDNAVEAVRVLDDPDRRVISISVFRVRDLIKIQVENAFSQSLRFQDDLPVTTKPDAINHGYGLKSIRRIVEQYEGVVSVEAENGHFILHILLPCHAAA